MDSLSILKCVTNYEGDKRIDASERKLREIPFQIVSCAWVRILDISNNKIERLGKRIAKLKLLEELNASNNNLWGIQKEILELLKLKKLNFSHNRLKRVPLAIINLPNLEWISFEGNPVTPDHKRMPLQDPVAMIEHLKMLANKQSEISDGRVSFHNHSEEINAKSNEKKGSLTARSSERVKGSGVWASTKPNLCFDVKNQKAISSLTIGTKKTKTKKVLTPSQKKSLSQTSTADTKKSKRTSIELNEYDEMQDLGDSVECRDSKSKTLDSKREMKSYLSQSNLKEVHNGTPTLRRSNSVQDQHSLITKEKEQPSNIEFIKEDLSFLMPGNFKSSIRSAKEEEEKEKEKKKKKRGVLSIIGDK